jgi:hypothetical protein
VFTATGLGTDVVDIELFNCNNVQNSGGQVTFTGSNSGSAINNFAVQGSTNNNTITVVNGVAQAAGLSQINGIAPTGGSITFTIANSDTGTSPQSCVTPVVFKQGTGGSANSLPLDASNKPTVPFGSGGNTTFAPSAPGATTVVGDVYVQSVDKTAMTFVGCKGPDRAGNGGAGSFTGPCWLFTWKSSDTYFMRADPGGSGLGFPPSNQTEFTANITPFDLVDVNCDVGGRSCTYSSNPATPNFWGLSDNDPKAPADNNINTSQPLSATVGSTFNTVTVKWTDSDTPSASAYNVYRASWVSPATTCPAYPNTTPASGTTAYAKVGTVADRDPAVMNNATTYTFTDAGLTASTNYCYVVSALDGTNEHVQLAAPVGVGVGTQISPKTPISIQSILSHGSTAGNNVNILDAGDVIQFQFVNGPITAAAGASITVTDRYGATATITSGGNATFGVNAAADTLSITITGPVVASTSGGSGDPTPTSINTGAGAPDEVASASGISNTNGAWNLAASGCQAGGNNRCFLAAPTSGIGGTATRVFSGTAISPATSTTTTNSTLRGYIPSNYIAVNAPNNVTISKTATGGVSNGDPLAVYNQQGTQIGSGTFSTTTDATITTTQSFAVGDPLFVNYKDSPTVSAPSNTQQWSQSTQLTVPSITPAVFSVSNPTDATHLNVTWTRTVTEVGPASGYTVWDSTNTTQVATGTAVSGSSTSSTHTVTLNNPLAPNTNYNLRVAAGTVNDTATGTPNAAEPGFAFLTAAGPPPIVTSVTPAAGPYAGGNLVNIGGSNFRAGATVRFDCNSFFANCNYATVNSVTPTLINVTVPSALSSGFGPYTVDIVVQNADGTSTSWGPGPSMGYSYGAPSISSISPTNGPANGGNAVTIVANCPFGAYGSGNFDNVTSVTFGGVPVSAFTISSSGCSINTTAPGGAAGAVAVVVTNAAGASNPVTYTYNGPALSTVTFANGGVVGTFDANDTITITFTEGMLPSSFGCGIVGNSTAAVSLQCLLGTTTAVQGSIGAFGTTAPPVATVSAVFNTAHTTLTLTVTSTSSGTGPAGVLSPNTSASGATDNNGNHLAATTTTPSGSF